MVDADLAELVFNHGDAQPVLFGEDTVEESGFARAEESCQIVTGTRVSSVAMPNTNPRRHFWQLQTVCRNEVFCHVPRMTPLVVIVGFLGSGKTTFLKSLLPELKSQRVAPRVIINDYQNAGSTRSN